VLVADNGKVLYQKGFGLANMEWNIPNSPDTKFRLGSITKQFTATLILQLVEQGKIKLDGKLTDYLPDYRKDTGDKVTIHNLLSHTSGIPSYTSLPGFFQNVSRNPFAVDDFIKSMRAVNSNLSREQSLFTTTPATFCWARSLRKSRASLTNRS
jgi:CubicO group peptidase (beta-lactamase class C family)